MLVECGAAAVSTGEVKAAAVAVVVVEKTTKGSEYSQTNNRKTTSECQTNATKDDKEAEDTRNQRMR